MNQSNLKSERLLFYLICLFLFGFCFYCFSAKETAAKASIIEGGGLDTLTDEELQNALKEYLGIRYIRAGASTKGFDCSGFVKVIYDRFFGIDLPHQSSEQSLSSEFEEVSRTDLRTGDLIFFSSGNKKRAIDHVGIYFSEGMFIHSAITKGVIISQLNAPYWRSRIVGTKRLASRNETVSEKTVLNLPIFNNRQDTAFFRYEKTEYPLFSSFLSEKTHDSIYLSDQFERLEVGYSKILHPEWTSQLNFFRESYSFADRNILTGYPSILSLPYNKEAHGFHAQGLSLSSDFRLSNHEYITSSLSYFDYGPGVNADSLPKITLGLTYGLGPSSGEWSLSTGLCIPLYRYASSSLGMGLENGEIDLTLTYKRLLSEGILLSLSGQNLLRFIPGMEGSASWLDQENENISLMLHFFY